MHITKVLGTASFIEQFWWLLLASVRKEFLKKKVNDEIAFGLISLFHVQIQEPASRSTATKAFAFLVKFIIAKHLKQEVDDLSVRVDEHNMRYKNLSMSCNQRIMTLLPQWRSALWASVKLFLLPKFDNTRNTQ